MRNIVSAPIFIFLVFLNAQCLALPPTGGACGNQSYTKSFVIERTSDFSVKATMKVGNISPPNPCSFWAKATLTSPSDRHAEGEDYPDHQYRPYQAVAEAILPMGTEDGTYTGVGNYRVEDDTHPAPTVYFYPATGDGEMVKSAPIRGYVWLTGTNWVPTSTNLTGGSTFNVHLLASDNCSGSVMVSGLLTVIPAGSWYTWHNVSQYASAEKNIGVVAGIPTTATFYLDLIQAGTTGTAVASGSLLQIPSGCDARAPATGSGQSATSSVTITQ